jgi:hypothetical protein
MPSMLIVMKISKKIFQYRGYVTKSGDFKNVMNSKLLHLFGFNTYGYSVDIKAFACTCQSTWRHVPRRNNV